MTAIYGTTSLAGGFHATCDGKPFGDAKATQTEAADYSARLRQRYPNGVELLRENSGGKRTRGGPWRWRLPSGDTGIVHTGHLQTAKQLLRRQLYAQRLPRGITWEVE